MDAPAAGGSAPRAYTPAEADRLVARAVGVALPHKINTACGRKAEAIIGELLRSGEPAENVGIVRSFGPNLSSEGLKNAYDTGALMTVQRAATPSFTERLRAGVGTVDLEEGTVEFEGVLMRHHPDDPNFLIVSKDGVQEQAWAPGTRDVFYNHIAATVRVRNPDGSIETRVIDPGYDSQHTLSLKDWTERQTNPDVPNITVLTGSMADAPGAPFQVRTEVMSAAQKARFQRVLENHGYSSYTDVLNAGRPAYHAVTSDFLRLQPEDPTKDPADYFYSYPRYFTSIIQDGNLLPEQIDSSGRRTTEVVQALAPVTTYQKWLELTGGIP